MPSKTEQRTLPWLGAYIPWSFSTHSSTSTASSSRARAKANIRIINVVVKRETHDVPVVEMADCTHQDLAHVPRLSLVVFPLEHCCFVRGAKSSGRAESRGSAGVRRVSIPDLCSTRDGAAFRRQNTLGKGAGCFGAARRAASCPTRDDLVLGHASNITKKRQGARIRTGSRHAHHLSMRSDGFPARSAENTETTPKTHHHCCPQSCIPHKPAVAIACPRHRFGLVIRTRSKLISTVRRAPLTFETFGPN